MSNSRSRNYHDLISRTATFGNIRKNHQYSLKKQRQLTPWRSQRALISLPKINNNRQRNKVASIQREMFKPRNQHPVDKHSLKKQRRIKSLMNIPKRDQYCSLNKQRQLTLEATEGHQFRTGCPRWKGSLFLCRTRGDFFRVKLSLKVSPQ